MDACKPASRGASGSWPSKRLIASYVLDWIVIFLIAGLGGIFNYVKPYMRPFSLLDLTISYPLVHPELVPVRLLLYFAGLAPALIIAVVALVFVPGPRHCRGLNRSQIMRLKFWELEKGWAGFCLSLAIAFFITQAMKNAFGKPRPNMLARCQPDLENIAAHVVGGYGTDISARWALVDATICTNKDLPTLHDGFRSFPSGHSSFSWSAMLYLSLFLCSKFAIAIPFLPNQPTSSTALPELSKPQKDDPLLSNDRNRSSTDETEDKRTLWQPPMITSSKLEPTPSLRNLAASPPNHLVIVAFIPIGVAIWVCSTRYAEFYHFGFDIISGSLIGILSAWFSFRWYHLPIRTGQGWAWGARSRTRAFGIGVGTGNYVGDEGWGKGSGRKRSGDLEAS